MEMYPSCSEGPGAKRSPEIVGLAAASTCGAFVEMALGEAADGARRLRGARVGEAPRGCGAPKPRNPRHFDTTEGGRVHHTLLVMIQSVKAIYTVSDTFWRPGGV